MQRIKKKSKGFVIIIPSVTMSSTGGRTAETNKESRIFVFLMVNGVVAGTLGATSLLGVVNLVVKGILVVVVGGILELVFG